jgi:hypothetical protein
MVDASRRERVGERARDVLLPGDLTEGRRAVLARENEVRHVRKDLVPVPFFVEERRHYSRAMRQ